MAVEVGKNPSTKKTVATWFRDTFFLSFSLFFLSPQRLDKNIYINPVHTPPPPNLPPPPPFSFRVILLLGHWSVATVSVFHGTLNSLSPLTREGHRQSDKHWNRFKVDDGDTSERRGGERNHFMGFSERTDIILN